MKSSFDDEKSQFWCAEFIQFLWVLSGALYHVLAQG